MASSYKSDKHNIPQYPGGALIPDVGVDYTADTRSPATRYEDGLTIMTLAEGDVQVTHLNGHQQTYSAVPAYFTIPGRCRSIGAATTAIVIAYI